MKIRFTFGCILLILALLVAGCGNESTDTGSKTEGQPSEGSANEETYTITIGHVLNESHSLHQTFEIFKEYVESESDGRIQVEIFPNGQIGNDRELIEGVQINTVTMAGPSTAPVASFVPAFSVFDLPFLFESREVAFEVLDSELGTRLLGELEAVGIKGMGYWESGYRHLTNSRNPVRTPEDLKGMVVRTMENSMHVATFERLGANPTPMAWGDVYVSLQQGALDGQENPLGIIYSQNVYEVQDYLTLTGHVYMPIAVLMNAEFYNNLPDELKTIVDKAMEIATDENRRLVVEEEEETLRLLKETGIEIIELTSEEIRLFQEATMDIYEEYKEHIGEELVEDMLNAVK